MARPITTSAVYTTVGIFLLVGGVCAILCVFFVVHSILIIGTEPEALIGFVPIAILAFALGCLFLTKAFVTLYGAPLFRTKLFRKSRSETKNRT